MIFVCICLAASTLSADPVAPTARTRYPYWQMVDEVATQIETQAPRSLSINKGLNSPGQEYPFESFRHLRITDLLRAAKEGVQVARQEEALGKPRAEVDQLVLRNIVVALEYLPFLIRESVEIVQKDPGLPDAAGDGSQEKESDQILDIIMSRDEDPVLRRFLLERTVLGYVQPDMLSLTLPVFFNPRNKNYEIVLTKIASHPSEDPTFQIIAIEVYLRYIFNEYEKVFKSDPGVSALVSAGESVSYAANPSSPELTPDTLKQLRSLGRRMEMFAESIAGHIGETSTRDERVKKCTRDAITHIRDSVIGVDKDVLNMYLEGRVPEPALTLPPPSMMPGMPSNMVPPEGVMTVPLPAGDAMTSMPLSTTFPENGLPVPVPAGGEAMGMPSSIPIPEGAKVLNLAPGQELPPIEELDLFEEE